MFHLISARYYAVTSVSTPPALAAFFPSSLSLAQATAVNDADLLLDATFEELSTVTLTALSQELRVPLLVLGPVAKAENSEWTYYFGGTFDRLATSLDTTLRCLGLRTVNLVGDSSTCSMHVVQALRSLNSTVLYEPLLMSNIDSVESYVGKVLRPRGNRMTVFTTRPNLTKEVLKAQFHMHIGGAGYANLLPTYSSLYLLGSQDLEDSLRNGNLIVAERDEVSLSTEEQAAAQLFSLLSPFLYLQSLDAKALLESTIPTHVRFLEDDPVLLNVQNSTKILVGQVQNSTCTITVPIHYLGNSTVFAHTSSASLPVSANFAETDPVYGFVGTYAVTVAALLAFSEINSSPSFLRNFNIEVWNFSAGALTPDMAALARVVLPNKDRLGAAIMDNIGSESTMPLISYLRQHNVTTPVVGAITSDSRLSSSADYPNFIRVCLSDDYVNTVIVQTVKHLGWTKCALLVVDSADGFKVRSIFQQLLPNSGIEIVNDPAFQVLSSNVKSLEEARANFTAVLQHIIDTRCRVIVAITIVTWDLVPLILYELGMRKGDLVIVGRGWIAPLSFTGLNEEQTAQTAEIMYGSIQLSPEVFAGTVGKSFEQRFQETTHFPPLSFSCQYYDAAYTIGHALDWLLHAGKDFLSSADMMKALRSVRFKGCTGLVYFEKHTNDRQPMRYTLNTLQHTPSTGLYLKHLGVYDPAGMVLLSIDNTFVWGDGTTKLPSNIRESLLGCPFEDRLNQRFEEGRNLLIGVCFAFFVYAVIVGLLIWRCFNTPLRHLSERKEITTDDELIMLGVFVDLVQSIALSANLAFASSKLQHVLSASIGDFTEFHDLKEGKFKAFWVGVESMNGVFLGGVVLLHLCTFCKNGYGLGHILLDLWVYWFAHWLFVPNLMVLLSVFNCTQGVANIGEAVTFESSYLAADCHLTCWTSSHTYTIAISVFTLLIYLAAAVFYLPYWQSSRPHLNVRADVLFLCSSPVFQLVLVALFLGIRNDYPILHASICLGTAAIRLMFCIFTSTYGYKRIRVRHLCTTSAVLYSVFISLCQLTISGNSLLFTILLYTGIAVILVCGEVYILLKVPGLLYRPPGVNTFHLFKFAFKPATQYIVSNLQREFTESRHMCSIRVTTVIPERNSEGQILSQL